LYAVPDPDPTAQINIHADPDPDQKPWYANNKKYYILLPSEVLFVWATPEVMSSKWFQYGTGNIPGPLVLSPSFWPILK